jgi:hypothetical protein
MYLSIIGGEAGKSLTVVSAAVTANWMEQSEKPGEEQLNGFLTGNSIGYTAGVWGGFNVTYSPDTGEEAIGFGFVTPQIGVSYNYQPNTPAWVKNDGVKW